MWALEAAAVECRAYACGVEAQRALRPVANPDSAELHRVLAHPLLGHSEHAGDSLGVKQAEVLANVVGQELYDPLGDRFQARLANRSICAISFAVNSRSVKPLVHVAKW